MSYFGGGSLIDWWRGCDWLSWLDEPGAVERPTEDMTMRRLALQSARALAHIEKVRQFIFMDAVKEVVREEWGRRPKRDDWTLKQVHATQGFRLEWREQTTKRGNSFTEIVRIEIPKAS